MSESPAMQAIRARWKLHFLADAIGMDRSLLGKKLRGERPPLTEQQARVLHAITGISMSDLPYTPDPKKETAA